MPLAFVLRSYPGNMYSEVEKYYRAYFEENGKPEAFPSGAEFSIAQRKFLCDVVNMNMHNSPKLLKSTAIVFTDLEALILKRGIFEAAPTEKLASELHCTKQNVSRVRCKLYQRLAICLASSPYWADHMNINAATVSHDIETDFFEEGDTFYVINEDTLIENMNSACLMQEIEYLPKDL